jgi:uncharacterized protein involved in response to NO
VTVPRSLLLHGSMPKHASRPRLAIAAKGFRPFFLCAALFAIATIGVWLLAFAGVASPPDYLAPFDWHAHEMIFGFTVAVIAGFLLTAVGNWTQRETLVGAPLLALAGLWVLGRIAMAFPALLPRTGTALIDLAFLPCLIVVLARPLVATKNYRNFVMLGVLFGLFLANLAVHLDVLDMLPQGSARRASIVAIDIVLTVTLIVAGRVFPMFTRNATGVSTIRSIPALDIAAVVGMVAVTALDAAAVDSKLTGSFAGAVGIVAAVRAIHWGARHSLREPLLCILHAGYA